MNARKFNVMALAAIGVMTWSTASHSTPEVSGVVGDLSHGSQLTISGSSFGVKSPAEPYLWAPFDGSADPSPLGQVTRWSSSGNMSYAPGEGISGSGALRSSNSTGSWAAAVDANGFAWNDWNQKTYLYRRVKRNFSITNNFEVTYSVDTGGTINWKTLRLWPSTYSYPNFYLSSANGAMVTEGIAGGSVYMSDAALARGEVNEWRTDEIAFRVNSGPSLADGELKYLVDGKVAASVPYIDYRGQERGLMLRDDSASGSSLMTRFYPVHGVKANCTFPEHYAYWVDDVYVDTTWARIMIGDADTFELSTVREIQIPSAWSGNSVTVTVNLRSFPAGATPHLFVIDSHGNASRGFPLTNVPQPKPPEDVKAD
jgi:hypothetical protein